MQPGSQGTTVSLAGALDRWINPNHPSCSLGLLQRVEAEKSQHMVCHGSSSCGQKNKRDKAEEKTLALRKKTTLPFPEQFIS